MVAPAVQESPAVDDNTIHLKSSDLYYYSHGLWRIRTIWIRKAFVKATAIRYGLVEPDTNGIYTKAVYKDESRLQRAKTINYGMLIFPRSHVFI